MKLLNKKSIGLDIADRTIEAVELESSGSGFAVLNLISAGLPEGVVENGRIKDSVKLAEALKVIFSETRFKPLSFKKVIFGLPESQVFLHNFNIAVHNKKDRDELVLQEVKLNIPIREDDLIYSYKVLSDTLAGAKFLIAAASRKVVKEWLDFFKSMDIEVEILDIETLALFRGLFTGLPQKPVCILDIGSRTANVCIFDRFGLRYSFSSFIAGDALTNAIMKVEGADFQTAEKIKIAEGLSTEKKKSANALEVELKKIDNTIKEALNFFHIETNDTVEEIVLVGGSCQLKGLEDRFKKIFNNKNVYIGSSRLHYNKMPLIYIEATGLAIRGLDKDWDDKDPNIPSVFKNAKGKVVYINRIKEDKSVGKIQKKILNKQTILLIGIVVIGAVLLVIAFWFRGSQRKARLEKNNIKVDFPEANMITSTTYTASPSSTVIELQETKTEKTIPAKKKAP